MNHSRPAMPGLWTPVAESDRIPVELRREGAFTPYPLRTNVVLSPRSVRVLADAQEKLGRLDEAALRLSHSTTLVRLTQVREAHRSAAVDGVPSALREVLASQLPGVRRRSDLEPGIDRYLRASDVAFTALRQGVPIDVALLQTVAAAFAGEGHAPERVWRTEHTAIGAASVGEVLVATPPGAAARAGLEQLVTWAAEDDYLQIVGRMALALYQLEVLRPFGFGNGHIARLFIAMQLARAGLVRDHLLPISEVIDSRSAEYWSHIRRIADTGDIEPWLVFIGEAIITVCEAEVRLIKTLEDLRKHLVQTLPKRCTGVIRDVTAGLIDSPVTNPGAIADRYGISISKAHDITNRLMTAKVITPLDDKTYGRAFVCEAVLRHLTPGEALAPDSDAAITSGAR
ncbi:Fic family protein [Actinokineospora iranica]|uniref:Fic family protein n=1 Tax=Actinokineospora iranica TaxID=1271860 RepID=A0A1G6Z5S9_9PSEU|nr:Fic/DOC family N-terminal domain-containing protein [Actinokineospora iranica]SDD97225.1 Fic family protein [Actinokineospora iranica]